MSHKGVNRLLCAALVDINFCSSLLEDPSQAYNAGFNGNYFELSEDELEMLLNIKAARIEDFALKVHHWLEGHKKQAGIFGNFNQPQNNLPGYTWKPIRLGNYPNRVQSMHSAVVR